MLGQCDGFKVAVSATPLTLDGYRAALLAGLGVYGLSSTRKLKRVHPSVPAPAQRLLEHPCKAWAAVPLKTPQAAVQRRVPCSAMCTGSCEECDPPPFDLGRALVDQLGARVVEIIIDGKVVYQE